MYGYVYLTTNSINKIFYVGQKKGKFLPCYLGSGKILKRAIDKYGRINFRTEILEITNSADESNQCEIDYIAILRAIGVELYNLLPGGECSKKNFRKTFTMSQSARDKISRHHKGLKRTEEQIEANRLRQLGKCYKPSGWKHRQETIIKMKIIQKSLGNKSTPEGLARSAKRTKELAEKARLAGVHYWERGKFK